VERIKENEIKFKSNRKELMEKLIHEKFGEIRKKNSDTDKEF